MSRAVQAAKELRKPGELEVPEALVKAIKEGNCVAFVGAGFSAAAKLPSWAALLEAILEEAETQEVIDVKSAKEVKEMINRARQGEVQFFDHAAQAMEMMCGREMIANVLGEKLKPPDMKDLPPEMSERLIKLFGIPFSAILTTNFDYFLPGPPAVHESSKPLMREILRGSPLNLIEQMIREIMMSMPYAEKFLEDDKDFQDKAENISPEADEPEDEEFEEMEAMMILAKEKGDISEEDFQTAREFMDNRQQDEFGEFIRSKFSEDKVNALREMSKLENGAGGNDAQEGEGSDVSSEDDEEEPEIGVRPLPIIQLHGTIIPRGGEGAELDGLPVIKALFDKYDYRKEAGLAFTSLGYRNLLHGNAYYSDFLKSVMATKTILYIGFSFSDAYIKELRSGTMMLLEQKVEEGDECPSPKAGGKRAPGPIAYAIKANCQDIEMKLFKDTEGVEFLNYIPKDGGPGFEGVEKWLEAIHKRTNPIYRWSRCMRGKKVLICAKGLLQAYVRLAHLFAQKQFKSDLGEMEFLDPPPEDEKVTSEQIAESVRAVGKKIDLILVGWKVNKQPMAKYFLGAMDLLGKDNKNCPVVVIASGKQHHSHYKKESMRMGAAGYVASLRDAFEEIMHVLEKPLEPEPWEKAEDVACSIL